MSRLMRVTGKGTIRVKPDTVRLLITLEGVEKEYGVALQRAARDTQVLQKILQKLGFEQEELKTLNLDINPKWDSVYNEVRKNYNRIFLGYDFTHELKLEFPKDNTLIFAENGTLKADADINALFREITDYLNNHPDIPKETLNGIVKNPLYKGLLKNIISNSFAMEPKDVTKPGEISKLYERVLKQTESLERLISSFNNKAAESIKNQTAEIKQNINFMNSANEIYNFVQIPLKMYNQNTDSMLYVKQNKKSSYEAGEEITSLKEANVGCKWTLASEDSMKLIEDNLDLLTERLAKKGFNVTSEVNCGEPKASNGFELFGMSSAETNDKSDGLVHRYSFDMRA